MTWLAFILPVLIAPAAGLGVKRRRTNKGENRISLSALPTREQEISQKFETYLKNNLASELSIKELEIHMGMSYSNIYRIIKAVTGQNLRERLLHYRIAKAKELLSTRNLNITEVMQASGFDNSAHFSKVFKDTTGKTPIQFRSSSRTAGN